MPKLTMTYEIALAAGKDAANRNMRQNGRTVWNEDDYNAAVAVMDKLLGTP
jgi:hypothetical protein